MKKKIILIFNPHSGFFLEQEEKADKYLKNHLKKYNQIEVTLFNLKENDLSEISEIIEKKKIEQIWIAGGDGTILGILPYCLKYDLPLGILPCGTKNLLARDLKITLILEKALEELVNSEISYVNVGSLNDKFFLSISNIGMTTKLTAYREKFRNLPTWLRMVYLAYYTIKFAFIYPTLKINFSIDGKEYNLKSRAITITVNPLSEQTSLTPIRESLNQDVFGIYIAKESSLFSLPRIIIRLLYKDWFDDEDMLLYKAENISFKLNKKIVSVMNDGELSKRKTPLHYEISSHKLSVLKPKKI